MTQIRDGLVTTGKRRFQTDSFPMRLYRKAKKLGQWDPLEIDIEQDKKIYAALPYQLQNSFVGGLAQFQAGEESVTVDLLPLVMAVADEGRIEEEMYLTTFLFEEAKHVEFFEHYIREVTGKDPAKLDKYLSPTYKQIFFEILPEAMGVLRKDPSPANQLRASITYNMIIEGVLAETGYFGADYQMELTDGKYFPGYYEGVKKLRQDESRHIAYGVFLISRLIAEHPDLWPEAEARMEELRVIAFKYLNENLAATQELVGGMPNDADPQKIMRFAEGQYEKRLRRIRKAREQTVAEVETQSLDIDVEAA